MNLGLEGRVALVTGASRGIGLAIAKALAAEGCSVALAARGLRALEHAAATISGGISIHAVDLQRIEDAHRLADEVKAKWQRLDVLVCNVGSGASAPPGQETSHEWQRVLSLNLFATTNAIEALRPLLASGAGDRAIVCMSSICGLAALGAPVTYSAAKAALNAAVRNLARPLSRDGIRINAVAPGNILFAEGTWARKLAEDSAVVNDMLARDVALGRFGTPEEIADIVTFLASSRATFITGTIVVADGGQLRA
jgi:3-oxoacyl-[acyl-carrier protein] reductase